MSNDDLERRLREAGEAPVPGPSPAFAEALEHRLRAGVPVTPGPVAVLRPARRAGSQWARAGSQWALAAAAVVIVVLAVASRPRPAEELRVASASDAVVVFPDGQQEPAVPGLVVPDGSVIRTGEEGRVVAGKVEVGPNREAVVSKGRVRPRPAAPVMKPPAEPRPMKPEPARPTPDSRGLPPEPPAQEPAGSPVTTSSTTATTRPKPLEQVRELKLEAWYRGTTVQLAWSPYEGPRFASYVILRSDAPAEPVYPADRNTKVVGRVTTTRVTDTPVADPGKRLYRVVAVDENGEVLAKSRAVAPSAYGSATPDGVTP